MRPMRGTPQRDQSKHDEDVGRGMEEPVEESVDLEVLHAVRRIPSARDHVMPLEHLVQHDAVEESAEAESEKDAGRDGELPQGSREGRPRADGSLAGNVSSAASRSAGASWRRPSTMRLNSSATASSRPIPAVFHGPRGILLAVLEAWIARKAATRRARQQRCRRARQ